MLLAAGFVLVLITGTAGDRAERINGAYDPKDGTPFHVTESQREPRQGETEDEEERVPDAPATNSGVRSNGEEVYRVREGDTLSGISERYYRDPRLYGVIADENLIDNPDLIFPDQELYLPPRN
jgi:nucleoid-associated protein YgaU